MKTLADWDFKTDYKLVPLFEKQYINIEGINMKS